MEITSKPRYVGNLSLVWMTPWQWSNWWQALLLAHYTEVVMKCRRSERIDAENTNARNGGQCKLAPRGVPVVAVPFRPYTTF